MPETYEIAPDGTPERLIQRLENANCGELFYCEADREEAVEIAQEEFATALAKAEAQARRDAFEEGRRQGLEEAAKNDHSKDFQLMMVRIIQRHRNGRDLTETLEGATDLLRRNGSLSPFRATAPAETVDTERNEA